MRDDEQDMVDHAWADRLLAGEPVDDDGGVSGVVAALRATADRPAPAPTAALALVLRDGLPPVPACAPARRGILRRPAALRQWSSRTVRVAAASLAATAAMGAGVATAEVSGVSTLDYVPEPLRRGVDAAVSAVANVFTADSPKPPPAVDRDVRPIAPGAPAVPLPDAPVTPDGQPALSPSTSPSASPSASPTPSPVPTLSLAPSPKPSLLPDVSVSPTPPPTEAAQSPTPSAVPSSPSPSAEPTGPDREPLDQKPSEEPSEEPSGEPSPEPSGEPTAEVRTDAQWDRPEGPRRAGTADHSS